MQALAALGTLYKTVAFEAHNTDKYSTGKWVAFLIDRGVRFNRWTTFVRQSHGDGVKFMAHN